MRNIVYNIRTVTIGIMVCGTMTACTKGFLDRNPPDAVSTEIFWASEADTRSALAGVYTRLQQNFLGYERVYLDGLSDNAWLWDNTNQAQMANMTTGSISATTGGALNNLYSSPFRAIASCNYFLDNIDKAPVTDALKNSYRAQVRFIRALCYFDLVQGWGGVPIYDRFPATLTEANIAKSTKEQVYTFINADLDFAIANLPDEKYNGYAVRGSAQGLKARVLVTMQSWPEAAALCQQIMTGAAGKFALSTNYAALFTTAGQNNAAVNTEIMFSTQYLGPSIPQRTSPGAGGMDIELGWFSLMQPYQDLVNAYEMTDGKSITESPLYNPAQPYANRDPRMDISIKVPGETWVNPSTSVAWTGSYSSFTGFLVQKYVDLSRAPFTNATATLTDQDYIHIRYADILLMFAEAKNEVSGPDESVYNAIDAVRGRTGIAMPATDRVKYNTKELLRDYIRHERRVEFAFEGQRYNDLKRWNIAHIKLPTLVTPANIPLKFSTTNYLLPFQQSELDNNPQLRQNDGY
ncbi:RagB/SusD family nutrient uptake outer membrane protein [Terrimonas sp. NA20]|uniref:RagB/SusD family nutrient uptake outer membrane protein n=1 Tax=Terrimonas ginsenosidimutans TaxID=2908004 RepID=A0ABS9KSK2_9BACT|nr:RagB/SusD family nutrient uptake outer membrane protein [Terrimonas ginsenosidimutans]MCG2615304.1 RagB/SusD family nutrient uptake outer membrane protein [Terrimonas ginsenosidimutans]